MTPHAKSEAMFRRYLPGTVHVQFDEHTLLYHVQWYFKDHESQSGWTKEAELMAGLDRCIRMVAAGLLRFCPLKDDPEHILAMCKLGFQQCRCCTKIECHDNTNPNQAKEGEVPDESVPQVLTVYRDDRVDRTESTPDSANEAAMRAECATQGEAGRVRGDDNATHDGPDVSPAQDAKIASAAEKINQMLLSKFFAHQSDQERIERGSP